MARNYQLGNIFFNVKADAEKTFQVLDNVIKKLDILKSKTSQVNKNTLSSAKMQAQLEIINQKLEQQLQKTKKVTLQAEKVNTQLEITKLKLDKIKSVSEKPIIDPQQIQQANSNIDSLKNKINEIFSKIDVKNQKGILTDEETAKEKTQLDILKLKLDKIFNTINLKNKDGVLREKDLLNANIQIKNMELRLLKVGTRIDTLKKSGKSLGNIFRSMFNIGKIYFFLNYTKRIANSIVNMSKKAIDFDETLNKFQVSMGDYYSQAIKFVNQLTYAFNLSSESVMNYMSTFKNMLDALGDIDSSYTYKISEVLTRMAIDYASLFNVSVERAMEQFQGTLSGQIRSIRTISGYDVSENSIFAIYQQLGGTKTMRQLDQVEKRLLRIIALQQQMQKTGAVDDFSKTINNTANMIKQLQETWSEIMRWLGTLMNFYLKDFIENILAGAIAVREMLKTLAIAKGYAYEYAGSGGLFGESITESAEEAENAVESLKTSLLGFDQLNILGESGASAITSDYEMLLSAISDYNSSFEEVQNNANKIAEKILTWLGYTKQVKIETDEAGNEIETITWQLGEGETNLSNIVDGIKIIGGILIGGALAKGVLNLVSGFKSMAGFATSIGLSLGTVTGVVAGITAIIAAIAYLYNDSDRFKETLDSTFGGLVDLLKTMWEILEPILVAITDVVGFAITPFLNAMNVIIGLFTGDEEKITKGIQKFFTDMLYYAIKFALDFTNIVIELINAIGRFAYNLLTGIVNIVIDAINVVLGGLETIGDWFGQDWNLEIKRLEYSSEKAIQPLDVDSIMESVDLWLNGEGNEESEAQTNALIESITENNRTLIRTIKETGQKEFYINGKKVSEEIYWEYIMSRPTAGIGGGGGNPLMMTR